LDRLHRTEDRFMKNTFKYTLKDRMDVGRLRLEQLLWGCNGPLVSWTLSRIPWTGNWPFDSSLPTKNMKTDAHSCFEWDSNRSSVFE